MNTKTCKKCNQTKSFSDFYKNKASVDQLTIYCKECAKESERKTYHKYAEIRKLGFVTRNLTRRNGETIPIEQYKVMLEDQKNCGICNQFLTKPYIDHNHTTGKIRMLLCHHCNTLLGMAKENTEILENAIKYLNKFK